MSATLRFVLLLALGVWIGEIGFFSFVVAPTLFGALGPARAGEVTSLLFPRYYALGTVAALVATLSAFVLGRRAAVPGWWMAATLALGLGLGAMLWASTVVHPRAQRLRAAALAAGQAPGEDGAFRNAHREAVVLNGAALLAALAGLALVSGGLRQ